MEYKVKITYCLWWKNKMHKFTHSTHNATTKRDWYLVFSWQTVFEIAPVSTYSTAQGMMWEETAEHRKKPFCPWEKKEGKWRKKTLLITTENRKFLRGQSKWRMWAKQGGRCVHGEGGGLLTRQPFLMSLQRRFQLWDSLFWAEN